MNILPKKYSHFKQKQYWDSFFQQLRSQNKNFEWYGTLKQYRNNLFFTLNSIYNRNNKQKSILIAHLGCGNSILAQEITQAYQIFDFSILNLDYSEAVIEQMRVRSKQKGLSEKIKYEVCNLLKPISEQLSNKFDMVLDKGTLDAILPQDDKANIQQIQKVYFANVVKMLKKGTWGSYVIISMLQQFVISTILQTFRNIPHFTITISQCTIPNSKLQPFYIEISYNPLQQTTPITLNLLNKTVLKSQSKYQIQQKIKEIQRLAAFTSNIKQLRNGQIAKFNILVPCTNRIRYMLEIVDNSSQTILSKNNCAVFIVPPGMEAQFASDHSLKQLQEQIGMSRTIFAKLVIGQSCQSVQEVKNDLNPILANFIQKGCNVKQVPYLTDGSFTERQYLYRDQEIFIEQVLQNGQGFRRLILKSAPSLIQSQFKLTYTSTKSNQEIVSIALPAKKGLSIGIDENYLDQGYCRTIYTGLSRVVNLKQSRGLHLGGGACTIAKFLHHKYPQINQLIVQQSKSVIYNCAKFFEWPKENKGFEVINAQAQKFIKQLSQEEKFDYIIVDINNKEQSQQFYPPVQFFQKQFLTKCANALKDEGVIVYNTIQLDQIQMPPPYEKLLFETPSITQVYKSKTSKENIVYFVSKNKIIPSQREGENIIVMKNFFKLKNKGQFSWQEEQIGKIQLVQPQSGTLFKQLGVKVWLEVDEQKKKKKKKK